MRAPLRCVTGTGPSEPHLDLRYVSAIVYLLTTFVMWLVPATALLGPSGPRGNRHSWRPPRWTRSALLMRPDAGASAQRRAVRREIGDHRPPSRQACEAARRPDPGRGVPSRSVRRPGETAAVDNCASDHRAGS